MKLIRLYTPIVLAILSIVMAGYQLVQVFFAREWADRTNEMVTKWDERIHSLRDFLPAGVTIVGYLDKSMIVEQPEIFDGEEFFLMQYSMAPVVLEIGIGRPWIVGNFDNKTDFRPWLNQKLGNYAIQNFGSSLYLIKDLDG